MEKPFDFKVLQMKLKDKGMDLAEEAVKIMAEETYSWLEESLMAHPNQLLKIGVPVLAAAKPELFKLIDKIDGKEG
jgi:hypothetical protein